MRWIIAFAFLAMATIGSAQEADQSSYFSAYPNGFPADPDQRYGTEILPRGRPFPSLPSDPRDLKIGLRKTSNSKIEGDLGGYRSIFGWKGDVHDKPMVLHGGIEGNAYFTMRKEGSKFPLETSDGLMGIYAEASRDAWFYQFRFTHISAHLADGAPNIAQRFSYSREFIVLRVARQWYWLRPYGGLIYLVHTIPKDIPKLGVQVGFYAIPQIKWGRVHPYFGADYRHRGGNEGSTLDLSAGFALTSTLQEPTIRIGMHFQRGHDLRGQFYNQRVRKWSAGLEMDF